MAQYPSKAFVFIYITYITGFIPKTPMNAVKSHNIQEAHSRKVALEKSLKVKESLVMIHEASFSTIIILSVMLLISQLPLEMLII